MSYRVGIALLLVLASAALAAPVTSTFTVDAEVRALGNRDYEIGTSTLTFTPEGGAGFRIQASGRVAHPLDAAAIYEYTLDMRFRLKADRLEIVSSHNTSNATGKEILEKVENIFPFAYLSRALPRTAKGYRLATRDGTYTMTYSGAGASTEVSIARGDREVARFFVAPASSGLAALPRFRIIRRNGANLMFQAR